MERLLPGVAVTEHMKLQHAVWLGCAGLLHIRCFRCGISNQHRHCSCCTAQGSSLAMAAHQGSVSCCS